MNIKRHLRDPVNGVDNKRSDRKVRHKMTVHHIHMEHIAAGILNIPDFLGQAAEVRGKQTGGEQNLLQAFTS